MVKSGVTLSLSPARNKVSCCQAEGARVIRLAYFFISNAAPRVADTRSGGYYCHLTLTEPYCRINDPALGSLSVQFTALPTDHSRLLRVTMPHPPTSSPKTKRRVRAWVPGHEGDPHYEIARTSRSGFKLSLKACKLREAVRCFCHILP